MKAIRSYSVYEHMCDVSPLATQEDRREQGVKFMITENGSHRASDRSFCRKTEMVIGCSRRKLGTRYSAATSAFWQSAGASVF